MMKIFNTFSGEKEEFKPLKKGKVGMYVCGPTVYDVAHLGHGRSAVSFDIIRRYFIYRGYAVKFVSNYTDIDDKMINRANEEGIAVSELAAKVIPKYAQDYGALGVMAPDLQPKATEYVPEMIKIIQKLEKRGYTYVLDDGVYFEVSKFDAYGELSKQDLSELKMGARVEVKESKRNPYDFVLWKFKKEGEPFWPSPWGDGRPGWHIECSAMSFKNLGETFDIHGGGLDLTFPHHECEVAQSVGAFGEGKFVRYWIHNGFINLNNEKMSKSLGNFFTLRDIFQQYDPQVVRFMFLQTHYRNPLNFSHVLLDQAKAALARLHDFVRALNRVAGGKEASKEMVSILKKAQADFEKAMDEDFDTSGALGTIFDLVKGGNILLTEGKISSVDAGKILDFLLSVDAVLGIIFYKEENPDDEVENLIEEREKARKIKDFARADEIRNALAERGIILEDTAGGTVWKKV